MLFSTSLTLSSFTEVCTFCLFVSFSLAIDFFLYSPQHPRGYANGVQGFTDSIHAID